MTLASDVGDGKQLTVIWHVDDLMASCVVDSELTKPSCYLASCEYIWTKIDNAHWK